MRFERTLKLGTHVTHPCPHCEEESPQVIEGFAFGFAEGSTIANSGVHKLDYPTADQAVGRDADKSWEVITARDVVKTEARKTGGTEALIRYHSRDHIDYEPMSDPGRKAHYKLASKAVAAMKRAREARGEK